MESFTNAVGGLFDKFNDFLTTCCEEQPVKSPVEQQVEGAAAEILQADVSPQIELVALEPKVRPELNLNFVIVDLGTPQVAVVEVPVEPKPEPISDTGIVEYCRKIYTGNFTPEDAASLRKSGEFGKNDNVLNTLLLADHYNAFKPHFFDNRLMDIIRGRPITSAQLAAATIVQKYLVKAEDRLVKSLELSAGTNLLRLIVPSREKWAQDLKILNHYQNINRNIRKIEDAIGTNPNDPLLFSYLIESITAFIDAMNSEDVLKHTIAFDLIETHVKPRIDQLTEPCSIPAQTKLGQDIVLLFNPANITPQAQMLLQGYHEELNYDNRFKNTDPILHVEARIKQAAFHQVLVTLENDPDFPLQLPPGILFGMHSLINVLRNPSTDATNPLFGTPADLQQALTMPPQQPAPVHHHHHIQHRRARG